MKTSQIALLCDVIEKIDELEKFKLKLIDFIQEDEENYLERTAHIKPVETRLEEASQSMKQFNDDDEISFERMDYLIKENEEAERAMKGCENHDE